MGGGCSRVCHIINSTSGWRGVAEFVTLQTLLVGGGCSRVCHIANSFSGGRGVAEFVTLQTL